MQLPLPPTRRSEIFAAAESLLLAHSTTEAMLTRNGKTLSARHKKRLASMHKLIVEAIAWTNDPKTALFARAAAIRHRNNDAMIIIQSLSEQKLVRGNISEFLSKLETLSDGAVETAARDVRARRAPSSDSDEASDAENDDDVYVDEDADDLD
mgnify:FL=1